MSARGGKNLGWRGDAHLEQLRCRWAPVCQHRQQRREANAEADAGGIAQHRRRVPQPAERPAVCRAHINRCRALGAMGCTGEGTGWCLVYTCHAIAAVRSRMPRSCASFAAMFLKLALRPCPGRTCEWHLDIRYRVDRSSTAAAAAAGRPITSLCGDESLAGCSIGAGIIISCSVRTKLPFPAAWLCVCS